MTAMIPPIVPPITSPTGTWWCAEMFCKPAAGEASGLTPGDGGRVIGVLESVCGPSEADIEISAGRAALVFMKEGDAAADVNGGGDGGEFEARGGGLSTKV